MQNIYIGKLCVLPPADYEAEDETPDEADKPDGEVKKPEGISLLMFVLIALTGFALFVLNITGVLCYLRRRSYFQGLSGKPLLLIHLLEALLDISTLML